MSRVKSAARQLQENMREERAVSDSNGIVNAKPEDYTFMSKVT
jgi:hypothetical protein